MAYFDWNATTPILPEAREAWLEGVERYWANPSSVHRPGRQARLAIEEAREEFASRCGVEAEQVVFTSGATEAINGFISGIAKQADRTRDIWISAVEHSAVRQSALSYWGAERVHNIPVTGDGLLDLEWIRRAIKNSPPALIAVMAANNETGVLSPWEEVRDTCHENGIPFFCDAVQWFGKISTNEWPDCGGVSISAHKFGGSKGTGCLILGKEFQGLKIQTGGSQENDSRAGTEDIPGILAMVAAFRKRNKEPVPNSGARDQFESALAGIWPGKVSFNGQSSPRLWNTSSVCLPSHKATRWVTQLDKLGFQVSSGSACSSGKPGLSPVLDAMGIEEERIRRSIRISGGWETCQQDWEDLLKAIVEVRAILDNDETSDGLGKVIQI